MGFVKRRTDLIKIVATYVYDTGVQGLHFAYDLILVVQQSALTTALKAAIPPALFDKKVCINTSTAPKSTMHFSFLIS